MLPANLLNTLKALALTQQPLPAAAVDAVPKAASFELGQKLQGTVQDQVAPGMFKVRVAEQLIQMQLPANIRSGDTVALQVISLQPRLTFGMVNSANPLSTAEQFGNTARLLSALPQQQSTEKVYVRAAQTGPLWDSAQPPQGKQLAGLLQEAVSNSGLFYESHQAQWLGGARSTAQLLREPQNLAPEQVRVMLADDVAIAATSSDKTSTQASAQSNSAPVAEAKALGIPEHLQPLVQQQLNTLETRQMLWQGEVWQGQSMQWEIRDQAAPAADAEDQRKWVTQLQLNLPNLGEVTTTLSLNSAGLSLALKASPQAQRVLGSAAPQLRSALADAGIPVLSTQVTQHDNAPE